MFFPFLAFYQKKNRFPYDYDDRSLKLRRVSQSSSSQHAINLKLQTGMRVHCMFNAVHFSTSPVTVVQTREVEEWWDRRRVVIAAGVMLVLLLVLLLLVVVVNGELGAVGVERRFATFVHRPLLLSGQLLQMH